MRYILLFLISLFSFNASAQLSDWDWRKEVAIKNRSNNDTILPGASWFILNGSTLDAAGKIKADFSDLRMSTDCDGTSLLDHWVENPNGGDSVVVWLNYPDTIFPSSEVRVFAFYGNSAATDVADFDAVFPNQIILTEDGTLDDVVSTDWFEVQAGVTLTGGSDDILYRINARRIRIDGTIDLIGLGEQTAATAQATGSGTGTDGFGGGGGGYGGDGSQGYDADAAGDPGMPGLAQGDRKLPSLDTAHAGGSGFVGVSEPITGTVSNTATFDGGAGGGRIFLQGSYITINELFVDGAAGEGADQGGVGVGAGTASGGNPPSGGGGGGAGGGVLIQASFIAVTGDLSADGGMGGNTPSTSEGTGGGGGGGRIKIFADYIYTGTLATTNGGGAGLLGNGNQPGAPGNDGTIYQDTATVNAVPTPELIVETRNGVEFLDAMAPNYVECRGVALTFTASENYFNYKFFINDTEVQSSPSNVHVVDTLSVDAEIYIVGATGSCSNTSDTLTVDVKTGPLSDFFPAGFNLTYNMDNDSKDATTYLWDFGDGTTSTEFEPQHKYAQPDSFTVCLTAFNPDLQCTSHITCQRIGVECNPPQAGFVQTQNGLRVEFRDLSEFSTSWLWDFGDGTTSTQKSPTHDYISAGNYTVTVTYTNECGSKNFSKTITVDCNFEATFNYTQELNSLKIKLENTTPSAQTSSWDFGDGTTSNTGRKTEHTYGISGSYNICLSSVSTCGAAVVCEIVSLSCTPPSVDFTFTTVDTSAAFFGDYSNNVGAPLWDFGDGNGSNLQNPTHEYAEQKKYNACLTVENSCGTVSECKQIDINCPDPTSFFDYDVVDGYTYEMNDLSLNGVNYYWELGDQITSRISEPSVTFRDDTTRTYRICLTVSNNCRETHRYCEVISVKKKPTPPDTTTTGIHSKEALILALFPNPVKDVLKVESNRKIAGVQVIDVRGKEMPVVVDGTQLNVATLSAGLYYLQIELIGEEKRTLRFIKE